MELNWKCEELGISRLRVISPFLREDERGYFLKSYEKNIYRQFGITGSLSETFETFSNYAVVRGLHFQTEKPQAKIVRVLEGEIFDVAVDLRKTSETFGKWESVRLSSRNHGIFIIPEGFAHGFQVLSDGALVSYQCMGEYVAGADTGIFWKDPELRVKWPLEQSIVSEKDCSLMSFEQFKQRYGGLEG